MIVSHRHKFIFVRTEKTAGSSLQKFLVDFCGSDDIVSGQARSQGRDRSPPWIRHIPWGKGPLRRRFPGVFGFHTHCGIRQVRACLDERAFASYFKFAIERNPWDRQISLYCQRQSDRNLPLQFDRDMNSISYRTLHLTRLRNWEIYTINGRIAVDYVIRYEDLEQGVQHVLRQIGIDQLPELPRQRSGSREQKGSYREFYTPKLRDLIARWYRPEIEAFGYEF